MSFVNVLRVPKGFDVEHVITQDVSLSIAKYKDPDRIRFVDEALARLAAVPVLAGLAAGLVGAFLVSRLISNQLYGVMPHDVSIMSVVSTVLMFVAVCACWIPARRATRISPIRALRFE